MGDRNNRGGGRMSDEERARAAAYQEYLKLREHRQDQDRNQNKNVIKDDTLYGSYVTNNKSNNEQHDELAYIEQQARRRAAAKQNYQRQQQQKQSYSNREYGYGSQQEARGDRIRKSKPVATSGSKNKADKPTKAEIREAKLAKKGKGGRKKKGKGLKIAIIIIAIIVVLLGAAIAVGLTVVKNTLDNIGKVDIDKSKIGIDSQVDEDLSNYRNIAILGIDARNMKKDKGSRSDSMIIMSINKENDKVKMFSVYRDTMLDLGDGTRGLDKVTHAYYYGGAQQSLYALNHNLDLNIKEVVVVNWKAVADAIDALGGIDVDIQQSEIYEMNKYIKNTAKHIGGSKKQITKAGNQHLNGVQAVTYARIRKDALTGDYRRNERMKIVVKKAFQKAKKMDIDSLQEIAEKVLPEIKTNMSSADLMALMVDLNKMDMTSSTTGWPYKVGSWSSDAWYGPPVTLASNVTKLHEKFFNQENYTPTQHVQDISAQISAKTGLY